MGDSVENQSNTSGVPHTPKSTVSIMDMLTSDGKSVLNSAAWNLAVLYPFYRSKTDEMVFSQCDSDVLSAAKLTAVVSLLNEGTKMARYSLRRVGVSDRIIYPFGN